MTRHVVAAADELAPGHSKLVMVGGREIALFNLDGEYFALANRCPHGGGSFCEGFITGLALSDGPGRYRLERAGEFLRCPFHGWEFEIRTGQSYCDPRSTRARQFNVAVEHGDALAKGPYVAERFDVSVDKDYVVVEV
jgi:nitrite reductase/ring-hydroxylating ferredoxin subunit